jgi:hypothetical protein
MPRRVSRLRECLIQKDYVRFPTPHLGQDGSRMDGVPTTSKPPWVPRNWRRPSLYSLTSEPMSRRVVTMPGCWKAGNGTGVLC